MEKPQTQHWIIHHVTAKDGTIKKVLVCSECERFIKIPEGKKPTRYCPHCGARLRGLLEDLSEMTEEEFQEELQRRRDEEAEHGNYKENRSLGVPVQPDTVRAFDMYCELTGQEAKDALDELVSAKVSLFRVGEGYPKLAKIKNGNGQDEEVVLLKKRTTPNNSHYTYFDSHTNSIAHVDLDKVEEILDPQD